VRSGINTRSKNRQNGEDKVADGSSSGGDAAKVQEDKEKTVEKKRRYWRSSQKKGDLDSGVGRLKINIDMPKS